MNSIEQSTGSARPFNKCVMIVAGEASGDLHGANLIRSMRQKTESVFFCGIGGQAMRRAGAKLIVDADRLSVVGITEVLLRLPAILSGMAVVKKAIRSRLPDLLVLIDFPDFNLRLAAVAKKAGIPVFYYITPQVWAWRKQRINMIRRHVDHAAVILPFEASFLKQHNIPATFVGHPLLDAGYDRLPAVVPEDGAHNLVIGLLPGSRGREVRRHLPIMLAAAEIIVREKPSVRFVVSRAPSVSPEIFEDMIKRFGSRVPMAFESGRVTAVFDRSDLVVAVSGTVTLEAALSETPMLVIYRVSTFSYWLARMLVRLDNISLVNLIAGEEIVPELVQTEATAVNVARHACELLSDRDRLRTMRAGLRAVREKLGTRGASDRAADIAVALL